jgi:hypothetical protein
MPPLRLCAYVLLAASAVAHSAGPTALAEFRSQATGAPFNLVLKETERLPRISVFTISAPVADQAQALFLLCSLSGHVISRGYSHLAVIEPPKGEATYVVGMFDSESESLLSVFGPGRDLSRALSSRPGPVAKLDPLCGRKPQ